MSGCCRDDQIAAVAEHLGDYSLLGTGPKLAATRIRSHGEVHNTYLTVLIAACLVGLATLLVYGLFIHGLRQRNLWMIAGLIVAVPGISGRRRESN